MTISHEKIIKRGDGSRIKILVSASEEFGRLVYRQSVKVCQKGKRTWVWPFDNDGYAFRKMSRDDRESFSQEQFLLVASKEEFLQAKMELWEKFKPQD